MSLLHMWRAPENGAPYPALMIILLAACTLPDPAPPSHTTTPTLDTDTAEESADTGEVDTPGEDSGDAVDTGGADTGDTGGADTGTDTVSGWVGSTDAALSIEIDFLDSDHLDGRCDLTVALTIEEDGAILGTGECPESASLWDGSTQIILTTGAAEGSQGHGRLYAPYSSIVWFEEITVDFDTDALRISGEGTGEVDTGALSGTFSWAVSGGR